MDYRKISRLMLNGWAVYVKDNSAKMRGFNRNSSIYVQCIRFIEDLIGSGFLWHIRDDGEWKVYRLSSRGRMFIRNYEFPKEIL